MPGNCTARLSSGAVCPLYILEAHVDDRIRLIGLPGPCIEIKRREKMDKPLDFLYSIAKKKYKIVEDAYSCYMLASVIVAATYFIPNKFSNGYSFFFLLLAWFLAIFSVSIGHQIQNKFNSELAIEASEKTQNILAISSSGDSPGPFFLYLRPFCITDKLKVKNPHRSRYQFSTFFFPPTFFLEDNINWESLLAESLEAWAPLIGLGYPSQAIGANLIKVKKWKKSVLALMEQATLIFIVPASSAGTKWEIEMLKKGHYLSKCLFILPEGLDPQKFIISQSWLTLNNSMKHIGVDIPEYMKKGIAFRLNEDGSLKEKISPFSFSLHFSFFSKTKSPEPQEIIGEIISKNLDNLKNIDTEGELEELKQGIVDKNKDCRAENHKQIDKTSIIKNEKKIQWLRKLEYFEKEGYLDDFKEEEMSFEEQVIIRFIEAVYFDKTIIQFIEKEIDTKVFEDSIKHIRLIKTKGNDVYVEIHQRNSVGLNIRRCVKFVISGVLIVNIEILEEERRMEGDITLPLRKFAERIRKFSQIPKQVCGLKVPTKK